MVFNVSAWSIFLKRADKLTICYNQITLFSYVAKQILNSNARVMML